MAFKLELGKFYKTRDGRKAEWMPKERGEQSSWQILVRVDECPYGWLSHKATGEYWSPSEPHDRDLISEWTDTPAIGTLAEIGAKVGDVVEHVGGERYEIRVNDYGVPANWHIGCGEWGIDVSASRERYRIISRAEDYQPSDEECRDAADAKGLEHPQPSSPVRTVTRTEIVPGVYGKVEVTEVVNVWMQPVASAAELTAAIETLTQIRDAMKEWQQ